MKFFKRWRKKKLMCEYFLREETSKIVRVFQSREKFRKSEYFCKHPKLCEDFGREHFNFFVIKRRLMYFWCVISRLIFFVPSKFLRDFFCKFEGDFNFFFELVFWSHSFLKRFLIKNWMRIPNFRCCLCQFILKRFDL